MSRIRPDHVPQAIQVSSATDMSVMQDDLAALLRALALGDYARPTSPHQVMVDEAIPAVWELRDKLERTAADLAAAEARIAAIEERT